MTVTYAKLKSGEWGLRVEPAPEEPLGHVEVTKRDGSVKTETAGRQVWRAEDDSAALFTLEARVRRRSGCDCGDECCAGRCRCDRTCNCRGGQIYGC